MQITRMKFKDARRNNSLARPSRIKRVQFIAIIAAALLASTLPGTGRAAGDVPQPLHKGMTEAQVEKLYGEPNERSESDSGTTWTYTKIGAKAFIPFFGAFSHSIKVITVTFRHGRLTSYDVEQ
jgi:hypothetical protein